MTTKELRAAMKFATSRNYVDIEMEAREAEGAIRILSAAVRELLQELDDAVCRLDTYTDVEEHMPVLRRYRTALEENDA